MEVRSGDGPLEEPISASHRATERALAPIGGSWWHGEVLFFAEPEKGHLRSQRWRQYLEELLLNR